MRAPVVASMTANFANFVVSLPQVSSSTGHPGIDRLHHVAVHERRDHEDAVIAGRARYKLLLVGVVDYDPGLAIAY
jgi:hypothetical protein